ncbi:MAG: M6 family metalloprotease domain-containing protein [Armatimonadetes bacterium]|nr:M6 family metalloprotease domain-containing protein [Armatimonadota bacterium]
MKIKMLIGFFLITTIIFAAYLTNIEQELIQPDGEVLNCFASGDEFHNWLHDENNFTIIQHPGTGFFVYAELIEEELVPTEFIAGRVDPESVGLVAGANAKPENYERRVEEFQQILADERTRTSTIGELNNLVVCIRFADQEEFTETLALYNGMFNLEDQNSMYQYFDEVSDEQLDITSHFYPEPNGNLIVSYQSPNLRGYYLVYNAVTNPIGYQNSDQRTQREHELLQAAVQFVESQIPTTLDLDNDDDGLVDNICFIIKGATGAWADLLWPHMWVLYSIDVFIHDVQVWTYNFQLSVSLNSSGVGVLCHEMFHSLGSPDLYHYTGNGISPTGTWDLMCSNTNPPQHMTTWMKYKYGLWFDEVPEINTTGTYTLYPVVDSTYSCYKIPSPNSTTEFFMVEYRLRTGIFEPSIPGDGLIIYRIDLNENGNAQGPPDEVYVFRPDGTLSNNGSINLAHFSADTGRTMFNDNTNPACFLQWGDPGGIFISDVGYVGDSLEFTLETGPIALFESNVQTGPSILGVQFYNTSYPPNSIISYAWDFDGDELFDSYEENPFHFYNEIGSYDVTLQISDGYETVETTIEDYITVTDASAISGNISGIWTEDSGPYTIVDDVQVSEDDDLFILPGVNIIIENNSLFTVNGMLQADASDSGTILFNSSTDWRGMKFSYTQEDNKLINCKFSNSTQSAVEIENDSNLEITNCVFYDNSSNAQGAAIDVQLSDNVIIKNNIIANNQSSTGTGGIRCITSSPQIRNNIIVNNTGQYGSLVFLIDSAVNLINNTLANNSSANSEIFVYNSEITILNGILITDASVINNVGGSADVTYSCISGGFAGEGNIDEDPMFIDPSGGNGSAYNGLTGVWDLLEGSSCIDAGNPDPIYNDHDGTRNDMGAFGGPNGLILVGSENEVIEVISQSFINTYPNPFNPETNIALSITAADQELPVTVEIYNIKGQLVKTVLDNQTVQNNAKFIWNGTDNNGTSTTSGLYFVKLKTASSTSVAKMMLIK